MKNYHKNTELHNRTKPRVANLWHASQMWHVGQISMAHKKLKLCSLYNFDDNFILLLRKYSLPWALGTFLKP